MGSQDLKPVASLSKNLLSNTVAGVFESPEKKWPAEIVGDPGRLIDCSVEVIIANSWCEVEVLEREPIEVDHHKVDSWEASILVPPSRMPAGAEQAEFSLFHMLENVADPVRTKDIEVRIDDEEKACCHNRFSDHQAFGMMKASSIAAHFEGDIRGAPEEYESGEIFAEVLRTAVVDSDPSRHKVGVESVSEGNVEPQQPLTMEIDREKG